MLNQSSHSYNKINQYLVKEILEATPQQLLIKLYDFAIVNAKKESLEKTNAALQELINSLNFEGECKEVSTGLFKLYLFCQEQMRKKNYEIVIKILSELKETWQNAFKSLR
ncbi:MAG: flagellar export chaperone FliS [Syntrophothermus sp.]